MSPYVAYNGKDRYQQTDCNFILVSFIYLVLECGGQNQFDTLGEPEVDGVKQVQVRYRALYTYIIILREG